ncbi:hypothetical protein [Rhizobium bangladeshense]|uniref:hypothetical protein n=1 Tax=Rhizobium bangladeshense TaxID=1138189 RepID=UPI001A98FEEB|nr:hypothetical protein [Rhizobium bangladeshense]MBY3596612.1 hypothetical protein [Rhizobium bangladeshense]MBY3616512.1 hypothetical protein [Rhizobium bangladeshense]QSY94935.1 hypothetical protein J2J97_03060 [Rhizobium bangladeshense]
MDARQAIADRAAAIWPEYENIGSAPFHDEHFPGLAVSDDLGQRLVGSGGFGGQSGQHGERDKRRSNETSS